LANLDHFSHENAFVLVKITFFQVEFFAKIFANKKNTGYNLLSKYADFEKISHNVAIVAHFFTQKNICTCHRVAKFHPKNISALIGGPFWLLVHFLVLEYHNQNI
jgi:hypothetical protein